MDRVQRRRDCGLWALYWLYQGQVPGGCQLWLYTGTVGEWVHGSKNGGGPFILVTQSV